METTRTPITHAETARRHALQRLVGYGLVLLAGTFWAGLGLP